MALFPKPYAASTPKKRQREDLAIHDSEQSSDVDSELTLHVLRSKKIKTQKIT